MRSKFIRERLLFFLEDTDWSDKGTMIRLASEITMSVNRSVVFANRFVVPNSNPGDSGLEEGFSDVFDLPLFIWLALDLDDNPVSDLDIRSDDFFGFVTRR